ncbi:MAG: MFS transporter [Chloroflexota bacterium]
MYQVENYGHLLKNKSQRLLSRKNWSGVGSTVFLLGLTSFLTDISTEMISTTLPLYLLVSLQFTPFQVGLIDATYQSAAVLVKVISGFVSDRYRKPKEVATTGYLFSAICKGTYLLAGSSWVALSGAIFFDRLGKGIRTSPRDAMIAATSHPAKLATAFGIHRALDTAGAMLGPLVAVAILLLAPGAYDAIFVVSACIAIIGVSVIGLFVQNPKQKQTDKQAIAKNNVEVSQTITIRAMWFFFSSPQFRNIVIAGSVLALFTVSDGLLYLTLQQRLNLPVSFFPLLFVITAGIYMLLAIPIGRIADRVGHKVTFISGYVTLALAYSLLLLPLHVYMMTGGMLLLLGIYYAATDGVLMALTSRLLPDHLRTTGLALLATSIGIARLFASTVYGAVWNWFGAEQALMIYIVGILSFSLIISLKIDMTPKTEEMYV